MFQKYIRYRSEYIIAFWCEYIGYCFAQWLPLGLSICLAPRYFLFPPVANFMRSISRAHHSTYPTNYRTTKHLIILRNWSSILLPSVLASTKTQHFFIADQLFREITYFIYLKSNEISKYDAWEKCLIIKAIGTGLLKQLSQCFGVVCAWYEIGEATAGADIT